MNTDWFPRINKHWADATKWLVWGCVLGLAPIWLSAGLLRLLGDGQHVPDLFTKGQLALYAASFAGTAMYLASIDRDPPGMRLRSTINLSSLVIWIIATGTYVGVEALSVVGRKSGVDIQVDSWLIVVITLTAYLASIVIAFGATLIDSERLDRQYEAIQSTRERDLADAVQELGDG